MWTAITATLLFTLSLGIPVELAEIISQDASQSTAAIWQPTVGAKFQITLSKGVSGGGFRSRTVEAGSAEVLDLDLFDTTKQQIQQLHAQGKRVICYFSAGSSESWRTDFKQLQAKDMGDGLRDWPREKWLDIRSPDIFKVMQARIKLASEKGCDGIDPDNVDAFGDEGRRGGGFAVPLTQKDSVDYVTKLATEAHQYGLAMGLKNAEAILPKVTNLVEFAVNEQCATYSGCTHYRPFINSGKPVFHIEYAKHSLENGTSIKLRPDGGHSQLRSMTTEQLHAFYCLQTGIGTRRNMVNQDTAVKISTVIKNMDLNNWVMWCDGTWEGTAPREPSTPKAAKAPEAKGAKEDAKGAKGWQGFAPAAQSANNEAKGAKTGWQGFAPAAQPAAQAANNEAKGARPDFSALAPKWSGAQPETTTAQPEWSAAKPASQPASNQGKGARPDWGATAPQWSGARPGYPAQPGYTAPQPAAEVAAPQPVAEVAAPQPAAPQPAAEVAAPQPAAEVYAPQAAAEATAPQQPAQPAQPALAPKSAGKGKFGGFGGFGGFGSFGGFGKGKGSTGAKSGAKGFMSSYFGSRSYYLDDDDD